MSSFDGAVSGAARPRWWWWVALAVGCGGPAATASPPAPVAERPPSTQAPTPAPTPAREACRIAATSGEVLRVAPDGVEPFVVGVVDGELALAPTDDGETLAVEVTLPLRFEATAPIEDQRLELAAGGEVAAGGVTLAEGQPVLRLWREEAALSTGEGAPAPRDRLRGEVQLGRRFPGARGGLELGVGPVTLECAALRAAADAPPEREVMLAPVPGAELAIATASPVTIRPVRLAPAELTLRLLDREGILPLFVVDRVGDDAHVVLALRDGSRVDGWMPSADLRAPTDEERSDVEWLLREHDRGPFQRTALGLLPQAQPGPPADGYQGPATLAPGTPIRAAPDGPPWARSPDHPIEVRAHWERGDGFAQLVALPGTSVHYSRAWVRRDALRGLE